MPIPKHIQCFIIGVAIVSLFFNVSIGFSQEVVDSLKDADSQEEDIEDSVDFLPSSDTLNTQPPSLSSNRVGKKEGVSKDTLKSANVNSSSLDSLDALGVAASRIRKRDEKLQTEEVDLLFRLFPTNYMKTKIGDHVADSIFLRYNLSQISTIMSGENKRYQYLKLQREKASNTVVSIIRQFFDDFPDAENSDDILIRYMELLYENVTDGYNINKNLYKSQKEVYVNSFEYKDYVEALKEYYKSDSNLNDTLEINKPLPPPAPRPPDPQLDELIEIYDQILDNIKDKRYIPHILFAKAYILGVRYKDYTDLKKLSKNEISKKREEAISILEQLLRRYPDNKYIVESFLLIGEFLFSSEKNQPRRTIESISYFNRALKYTAESGVENEYYEKILYKLAWAHFRIDNYDEALTWFNFLMEDIERNEEKYVGKALPDYILIKAKDEIITNLAECFLKLQRKIDGTKSASDLISEFYRTSLKFQVRRYIPLVYHKLGDLYDESAEFEKVREVYEELLRKYPNYENAPYISSRILDQLVIMTRNGEFEGEELEMVEQQVYEARKNLFYRYGKGTPWYENIRNKIDAEARGIILPFAERSIVNDGFNQGILEQVDKLGKVSIFQNIIDGVTKGQLYDGDISAPRGSSITVDKKKAKQFYEQAVEDIDNYLRTYPAYDSSSFYAAFQKAQIQHFKLNKLDEAIQSYLKLATNYSHDSLASVINNPSSPQKSYRKHALDLAYKIAEEMTKESKTGFYTPNIDTISTIPKAPAPLYPQEIMLIDVLEVYTKLFPHDTTGIKSSKLLLDFYAFKGYLDRYEKLASRSSIYYPVQTQPINILALLAARKFENADYYKSELIAKGIYYAPFDSSNKKSAEIKEYAYDLIGSSIAAIANLYSERKQYVSAAKEYERAVEEVPRWKNVALAAQLAANNYANAGLIDESVKMNKRLISLSDDIKQQLFGYRGLIYAYQKSNKLDSVASILEAISDRFVKDSAQLAESSLLDAIRISEQANSFKQAIALSDKYVSRYPQGQKSYQVLFNKINLSKKLGDLQGVFDAYGEFADKYSDTPLSVEAYFRRGDFAREYDDIETEKLEYEKAYARNKELPEGKKNNVFAAEALHRLIKKKEDEYYQISLNPVISEGIFENNKIKKQDDKDVTVDKETGDDISFDTEKKIKTYKEVNENLLKIIELGGFRTILSLYKVALLSEELGRRYIDVIQPIRLYTNDLGEPIPTIKMLEGVSKANSESAYHYKRSGEDYLSVWSQLKAQEKSVIDKIRDKQGEASESILELKISEKSFLEMERILSSITSGALSFEKGLADFEAQAVKWTMSTSSPLPHDILKDLLRVVIDRSRRAAITNLFKSASLQEENAMAYAKLEAPQEVKNLTKTIGKGRNKISVFLGDIGELNTLSKFVVSRVRPYSQLAVAAYDSVIKQLRKKNIDSPVDVVKAENKILGLLFLPVNIMDSLVSVAGKYFEEFDKNYEDRINQIDAAERQTEKDVIDLAINKVKMNQLIQVINNLTTQVINEYSLAYKAMIDLQADDVKLNTIATRASKFIYESGIASLSVYQKLREKFTQYNDNANEFFDKDWYGTAAVTYDPIQSLYLSLSQNILGQAVILISDFNIQNEYTIKALRVLVESDRAKYLADLGTDAVSDTVLQGNWVFSLGIPEDDEFEWFKRGYSGLSNWEDAVQNSETKTLQYIAQESDDVFVLRSTSANSYWYRKPVISTDLVSISGSDSSIQSKVALNEKNDVYEIVVEFDKDNQISEESKSKIEEVANHLKKIKNLIIEISPSTDGLTAQGNERDKEINTRGKSILEELENLGIDKTRLKLKEEESFQERLKTIFKVIDVLDKKDESYNIKDRRNDRLEARILSKEMKFLAMLKENYSQDATGKEFVYMRSSFEFKDAIRFSQIVFANEAPLESIELYVNEVFVDLSLDRLITTDTMSYHYDDKNQLIFDITDKVVKGDNTIAIKLPADMKSEGLKLLTYLSYYGAVTQDQLNRLIKVVLENKEKNKEKLKESEESSDDI